MGIIKLTWDDIEDADGYEIKIGNKSYFSDENSFKTEQLTGRKAYSVRVRSVYIKENDEET